jgi:hypothetical protein
VDLDPDSMTLWIRIRNLNPDPGINKIREIMYGTVLFSNFNVFKPEVNVRNTTKLLVYLTFHLVFTNFEKTCLQKFFIGSASGSALDLDSMTLWIRIRIELKGWIRIRIEVNSDP